ncbi:MAG: amidohydrolase, partial [Planctomycetota bacterium]
MTRFLLGLSFCSFLSIPSLVFADETTNKPEVWDLEEPPGPAAEQKIDCDTGTWINLDVSPDGKQIVFDLLGDLYLMPITGADGTDATGGIFPTKLTDTVAWEMQPRFSPDGKHIAMTSDRRGKSNKAGDNLWILDADGKNPTQVTDESYRLVSGPSWSPDGQYLVGRKHFTSRRSLGAGEMWMYHRDAVALGSTAGIQLTKRPNDQKDVNEPVYSPDGNFLYYSQDITPGDTFEYDKDSTKGIYAIKRLDLRAGTTEVLIQGPGGACRPTPSPDGKTLAFVRRVGAKTGLHLFDLESGAIRLVDDDLERDMQEAWAIHGVYCGFDWTPDSKSIVLWAKGKIRRIEIADGSSRVIPFRIVDRRKTRTAVRFPIEVAPDTFDVKMLRDVCVSPDGSQVAYQALGYIYVKALPDGEPQRLTSQTNHFEFAPSYSRDGRYIVYTTWNDQTFGSIRIASVDKQANENWVVTQRPGHYFTPVFTPDGEHIVYQRGGGGHLRSSLWSRDGGLYSIAVRDGEPELITKGGGKPQFGADGSRVFLIRSEGGKESDNVRLYSVDLSGNDERVHYSSDWATDARVSPDGRWLAWIERFHVYVAPFIQAPDTIKVSPTAKGLPIAKVSEEAGDFVQFSGDSASLHWSLGPELFTAKVSDAMRSLMTAESSEKGPDEIDRILSQPIGFQHAHAKPEGWKAIVGGRILTMGDAGIIEDGVILIEGNRIRSVGKCGEIEIPESAMKISAKGRVVLPGFIDAHAHGAQATGGITPQQNWVDYARLAFGVTTIHDPSNDTHSIFAASEMTKAGVIA